MQTELIAKPVVEIFCDFDGTITTVDTTDFLLEELAKPGWQDIEDRWLAGEISSRQCMGEQVRLLSGGWPAIMEKLALIQFDPYFAGFASWCKENNFRVGIVSDGIDKVIEYMLARENVTVDFVVANRLHEANDDLWLEFPFSGEAPCLSGVCKCKLIEKAGGPKVQVVIGDGRSDFCWAKGADVLFAKSKLASYCNDNGIKYNPFEDFLSIQSQLGSYLRQECWTDLQHQVPSSPN